MRSTPFACVSGNVATPPLDNTGLRGHVTEVTRPVAMLRRTLYVVKMEWQIARLIWIRRKGDRERPRKVRLSHVYYC
jgi:hypothetical protein